MASEQLAVLLGYEFTQIAASLDVLQRAGLVTASENPIQTAHLFVFTAGGQAARWLPDLLQLASTRQGRLTLVRAMIVRSAVERRAAAEPGPRPPGPGLAKRAAAPRPAPNKQRKGKTR